MVWVNRTLHRAAQAVLVKVGRGIGRFKDEKRYSWLGNSLGQRPARGTWELMSSIDDSARVARMQSDESRRVQSHGSRTHGKNSTPDCPDLPGENRGVDPLASLPRKSERYLGDRFCFADIERIGCCSGGTRRSYAAQLEFRPGHGRWLEVVCECNSEIVTSSHWAPLLCSLLSVSATSAVSH